MWHPPTYRASNAKVPIIIAVGKKESAQKTVSVRRLGSQETKVVKLDDFATTLQNESSIPNT